MRVIEIVKKKIESAEDLQSIVRTMKVLAAVSIRQYEQAVVSLSEYYTTIEYGFQILLRNRKEPIFMDRKEEKGQTGMIIFGSGQGLCGRFNEQISLFALEKAQELSIEDKLVLAVGHHIAGNLELKNWPIENILNVPGSIGGIQEIVAHLLSKIEEWRFQKKIDSILLFHNKPVSGSSYIPRMQQLFPLDRHWFNRLKEKEWPTNKIPTFTMEWEHLFKQLIRQYIFVSLYRAMAESLASEQVSRLVSMQSAEKKITDHLNDLNTQFRDQRQTMITDEIIDIMSGYEVVMSKPK